MWLCRHPVIILDQIPIWDKQQLNVSFLALVQTLDQIVCHLHVGLLKVLLVSYDGFWGVFQEDLILICITKLLQSLSSVYPYLGIVKPLCMHLNLVNLLIHFGFVVYFKVGFAFALLQPNTGISIAFHSECDFWILPIQTLSLKEMLLWLLLYHRRILYPLIGGNRMQTWSQLCVHSRTHYSDGLVLLLVLENGHTHLSWHSQLMLSLWGGVIGILLIAVGTLGLGRVHWASRCVIRILCLQHHILGHHCLLVRISIRLCLIVIIQSEWHIPGETVLLICPSACSSFIVLVSKLLVNGTDHLGLVVVVVGVHVVLEYASIRVHSTHNAAWSAFISLSALTQLVLICGIIL